LRRSFRVYRNALAAFLPVNRKRLAFLPVYRNASAAFLLVCRNALGSVPSSLLGPHMAGRDLVEAASGAPE
jgi:hypothetical protein